MERFAIRAETLDAPPKPPEPPAKAKGGGKSAKARAEEAAAEEAEEAAAVSAYGVEELLYALTLPVGLTELPMMLLPTQLAAAAALTPALYASLSASTQSYVFTALCTALHQQPPLTLPEGPHGIDATARSRAIASIAEGVWHRLPWHRQP